MLIERVELCELRIPLRFKFDKADELSPPTSTSAVVVIYTADGHVGYGEACLRSITGGCMSRIRRDLNRIRCELLTQPIESPEALRCRLRHWTRRNVGAPTRCAVELAWLDAWSRSQSRPMTDIFGIDPAATLSYSLILPLLSAAELEKLLDRIAFFQPPAIKLKVDDQQKETLAKIQILRNQFGSDTALRLDIEGNWTLQQAVAFIPQLMDEGIRTFEQPLPARDLEGLQRLTACFGENADIMVDETLLNAEVAQLLLENQICNSFNLKLSNLGGLFAALDIYNIAQRYGIPCQLGAHYGETSILTAAGALLARLTHGRLTACEGAISDYLLQTDISRPGLRHENDGRLPLSKVWPPGHYGLTPNLDVELMEEYVLTDRVAAA